MHCMLCIIRKWGKNTMYSNCYPIVGILFHAHSVFKRKQPLWENAEKGNQYHMGIEERLKYLRHFNLGKG